MNPSRPADTSQDFFHTSRNCEIHLGHPLRHDHARIATHLETESELDLVRARPRTLSTTLATVGLT